MTPHLLPLLIAHLPNDIRKSIFCMIEQVLQICSPDRRRLFCCLLQSWARNGDWSGRAHFAWVLGSTMSDDSHRSMELHRFKRTRRLVSTPMHGVAREKFPTRIHNHTAQNLV